MLQLIVQNWAILAVLGALGLVVMLARVSGQETTPPFERRGSLVNDGQLKFYRALQAAVGGSWSVFARVPLSDLVHVPSDVANAPSWREKTVGRHVDFIVCDNDSLHVCLAVELCQFPTPSDSSRGDVFIREALRSAGLPLLQIEPSQQYDKIELRKAIDQLLGKK